MRVVTSVAAADVAAVLAQLEHLDERHQVATLRAALDVFRPPAVEEQAAPNASPARWVGTACETCGWVITNCTCKPRPDAAGPNASEAVDWREELVIFREAIEAPHRTNRGSVAAFERVASLLGDLGIRDEARMVRPRRAGATPRPSEAPKCKRCRYDTTEDGLLCVTCHAEVHGTIPQAEHDEAPAAPPCVMCGTITANRKPLYSSPLSTTTVCDDSISCRERRKARIPSHPCACRDCQWFGGPGPTLRTLCPECLEAGCQVAAACRVDTGDLDSGNSNQKKGT